jgi:hypothetical protein
MADIIKCPVCGESNLPDQEFCQYCQSRLQPLTGNLKGADAAIKPGQAPTKKNTAELEPILPQWLRDARDSARKSAEDNVSQAGQQPQESFSASSTPDLLAGLQSQTGSEEEETPDWLANITGAAAKPKKPQTESPEVRWVELGGAKDFAQEESEAEPFMPSWLEGIAPAEPQANEKDELTDWFRKTDDSQKPQQPEPQISPFDNSSSMPAQPAESGDTPDWLKKMAAESAESNDALFNDSSQSSNPLSSNTPDWLRQMAAEDDAPKNDLNATPSDAPDWLRQMVTDDNTQNDNVQTLSAGTFDAPATTESIDAPDWLRAMGDLQDQPPGTDSAAFSEAGSAESEASEGASANVPDWMKDFPSTESGQPSQTATPSWLKEEEPAASAGTEVPSWLSSTPTPQQEPAPAQDEAAFGDIPSWLKAAAPQSSVYESSSVEPTPAATTPASDSPDWLNAFKSIDTPDAPDQTAPPAFTPDSQSNENVDALFAEMPDWLSSATDTPSASSASSSSNSTSVTDADALTPGELPSWVQAMRPVDTGSSSRSSSSSLPSDQTLESRGALAGLQGVLPSVPGYAPTSKPKAYSIKLQASEEQQAHATLLEQILAAETEPVPIASFSALTTSRVLRWFLAVALFAVLITVLFLHTQIFPRPLGVPPEINGAFQVSQSIPEGAPVLAVFDYEPARAGEMEAAAAPMFNLLKQLNFTFISTNETGAILADRFISQPFADTNKSGFQVLNVGYLPGGQMGIRAFAQDPEQTTPQLKGITSLSQFTALIIITDSADSARSWIEQTSSVRGAIPIVIISSAQAAPMIQPYYESQQISGLVNGLYGSAVFEQINEQNNGGIPGISRSYWDAYSLGMLLAMILIVGGGLWNLILGLRNRVTAGDAK